MSLVPGVNNPAIDNLIQSCKYAWIPYEQISDIEPTQIDNVYYATHNDYKIMLLCLGSSKECTTTLVSEFSRIYSLPTHKHNNNSDNFRRYSVWLNRRNNMIEGFTKS